MVSGAAKKLFFDDEDEGPARETSHPAYREICAHDFFYSVTEEFAPFGSDAGADGLHDLEDAYREHRKVHGRDFLEGELEGWGFTLPDFLETRPEVVREWLEDDELSTYVDDVAGLVFATAFGQLKICGKVDREVHTLALAAVARATISVEYWRVADPKWAYAAGQLEASRKILVALEAMSAGGYVR